MDIELTEPVPFEAAVKRLTGRRAVPSWMRTDEWSAVPLALRERAFFSAGVESARVLESMQERIGKALDLSGRDAGEAFMGRSKFVADMRQSLGAAPGDSGKLTDITSQRRLELIYDMNVEEAHEYGRYQMGQEPALLEAFPAWELVRVEGRKEERDWSSRWQGEGGQLYGGRMIARKDDDVWVRISRFERPYPPFDFGSGMGVEDVERDEAVALGVIAPEEIPASQPKEYNEALAARAPQGAGREWLQSAFGKQIEFDGDKVNWKGGSK